ncbi:MAG: metal-dependent transcriptional regulator [Proteobacteria bacterium]|nr:metal-dependent transcriptional regulator [Pseudomonadota bacterium]MBU1389337.1 metal-dependent transcriptional regulator [Pseudomonadota bacterium]MBU1544157.1 metal-dependent transcriptional regulator [Pseudomonadota bacterium]MBU2480168.1 metal-dependent transcriptional regulator [Pseudomonadota bacterium]
MNKNEPLSQSLEDYLEIILELQTQKTVARSKDIAEKMDIKRGSVTGMLKKLAKSKLINYEPYGYVTLTPEGKKIAVEIEHRHIFLKDFFFRILKVDEATADQTACQMEHTMDTRTFKKFKDFVRTLDTCPNCSPDKNR